MNSKSLHPSTPKSHLGKNEPDGHVKLFGWHRTYDHAVCATPSPLVVRTLYVDRIK